MKDERVMAKVEALKKLAKESGLPPSKNRLPKGRSSLHDIIKTQKQADDFMKRLYECAKEAKSKAV